MSFQFFEYTEKEHSQWNEFVLSHPHGSIHQVSEWKDFQKQIPGRETVLGFGVRENSSHKILAVTFCVQMQTGFAGQYWWYSARGPIFDPQKNSDAGLFLMQEIHQRLQKKGGMFWRIDPYFSKKEWQHLEKKYRSLFLKKAIQNYQPTDTLEIDLTQSDENILAQMKRKGRYNIKLAQKKGVRIQVLEKGKCTSQDMKDFWRLNQETTSRDRFSGHEKSYYEKFLNTLSDYAVLFFAEYEGERIATAISTFCGKKAIYYFGASTSNSEYRNLMAPYLLQWEMMQYGKKRQCHTYDFLGIAPEGEEDHPYSGISEFKWKFGGERRTYAPGHEIVLNTLWYTLYRIAKLV
ncbi:peptidoglycan bridge formation glycyltransferase FemA/FemB family protein [Candidatus Gracilibacteria bacterium]|nr:peptidoglycan bridge formation glycyltransferase FemA/FemB family protein [Candidatus Gracilibacteria bacterium]MCF7819410.1 peptidoglycan bridge formation glycyltransferase FemA/FemB family protein [Candidatus Gracilibacteria bacterium]